MRKLLALTLFILAALAPVAAASTLADVKARGKLLCGVNPGLMGFALKGDDGNWSGLDVDYCRAVAAAVLGDATKVDYVPIQRWRSWNLRGQNWRSAWRPKRWHKHHKWQAPGLNLT